MPGFFRKGDNAWLAADRRERLKNAATVVILVLAVIGGIVMLIVGALAN